MKILIILAVAAALVDWSHAYNISVEIPMENSWYELQCTPAGKFEYWLLHGKGQAYVIGDYTMEELKIYANGSIIFQSIKITYAGTHLCVLSHPEKEAPKKIEAHPIELRVRPKRPDNLWSAVYESQFVTGLIAALVCFTIFALSCLVYNKRWRPAPTDSDVTPIIEKGYDNEAMANTGDDVSSSTKM